MVLGGITRFSCHPRLLDHQGTLLGESCVFPRSMYDILCEVSCKRCHLYGAEFY